MIFLMHLICLVLLRTSKCIGFSASIFFEYITHFFFRNELTCEITFLIMASRWAFHRQVKACVEKQIRDIVK